MAPNRCVEAAVIDLADLVRPSPVAMGHVQTWIARVNQLRRSDDLPPAQLAPEVHDSGYAASPLNLLMGLALARQAALAHADPLTWNLQMASTLLQGLTTFAADGAWLRLQEWPPQVRGRASQLFSEDLGVAIAVDAATRILHPVDDPGVVDVDNPPVGSGLTGSRPDFYIVQDVRRDPTRDDLVVEAKGRKRQGDVGKTLDKALKQAENHDFAARSIAIAGVRHGRELETIALESEPSARRDSPRRRDSKEVMDSIAQKQATVAQRSRSGREEVGGVAIDRPWQFELALTRSGPGITIQFGMLAEAAEVLQEPQGRTPEAFAMAVEEGLSRVRVVPLEEAAEEADLRRIVTPFGLGSRRRDQVGRGDDPAALCTSRTGYVLSVSLDFEA